MLFIAFDPIYAHPLPEGHRFPMLKYELIPEQLLYEGLIKSESLFSPEKLDEAIILLTHEQNYWERLRDLKLTDAEIRRSGFPLSATLVEREIRIARGTIDASIHALEHGIAFNVAGGTHHAGSNWAEGFCLLNDQAIAANYLLSNSLADRILIIDLDVHQGNGTAEIFSKEERVFTFSMHAEKNFPFRKEQSDLDIGLLDGTSDAEYLKLLSENLKFVIESFKPDFIFYLAGVDVLATDKLGKLNLSIAGCKQRDELVLRSCRNLGLPIQISLGGGYSPKISDIVEAHCNTFRIAHNLYF
ncbi:MAG: histone deacetylase [Sphingobacteriales bacterium 17-39-43]|uniref:histone deacetylase family protein n=1 Tax=Daejeonella sp. TaxID=2805397 RepID=UPI000BDD89D0|nr:histone deacetylase [Daejeonella sp.]OYZ32878.1 MAG: histone deacetylase [Sphingobacteriales bacterium 16-39-50]OZA26288.1 MAG: histone deacetylase [Sphingobacteriales bacterium 17-39-43]HQT23541.1 histone deacetylase [Daejeonella sp.]HQT56144.1 histone deacetylase [Daejeonella sp.]